MLLLLYDAISDGDITRFNHLLEQPETQAELNSGIGSLCLMSAIMQGRLDFVKTLISFPPSVFDITQYPTTEGATSYLVRAAIFKQIEIFKIIAETGKVNLTNRDDKGATPLHWASKAGCLPIVDFLLQQEGINPDEQDNVGQTPLMWAANAGKEDVVRQLLQVNGVNPDAHDPEVEIPFYWPLFFL
ncbi:ankyrin repeat-containing domain protein [Fusarium flagelliforme]|uniref:ankyrin repeat-containing domain protein n=1 Tax=Fusarium flagelliforme TaxID=2675880 RepID=UPI001E8CF16B|nr:ankyrin repeat-containing domain protein [Fusarium flagelliforme]KAH7174324.1 ankyrin repeat-containing domain protein [Fusarium flagelliforme]